jgi:lysophospholipase L1-like esterase
MKLRGSKRTSIIGAGRMVVARRRGEAPVDPEQVIEPFAVGTLSFAVASLDVGMLSGATSYFQRMLDDYGLTGVTVRSDAVAGRNVAAVKAALPALLTTLSALPNPVIAFSSLLGNDVTDAFDAYNSAAAAPGGYWEARMADVDDIADLCEAAGVKPVFGNVSYRNYGTDNRCRSNEDLGSAYVNRVYFEPWLKARYPQQWDDAADRPIIDDYANSWTVGDWCLIDYVHCTALGYQQRRRWMSDRIASMSLGVIPRHIGKPAWPVVASSSTQERIIIGYGTAASVAALPAGMNRFSATGSGTSQTPPATVVDVAGAVVLGAFTRFYGQQNSLNTGRGNSGDSSVTLTNNNLLIGSFYQGGATSMFAELSGLAPNAAIRVKYNASASVTATVGDKSTDVRANSFAAQTHVADEAAPSGILAFDTITDPLGFVHVQAVRSTGGTNSYVSGIEVAGRSA